MTKRFSSLFFLCIFGFSMLLGLLPHTAYATNTVEEDMQRRKLTSLVECLGPDHISDGDNIDNFNDFWDGGDGKAYREEKMVVGLDRDSGNGVQSCQTVLIAGIHVFTNQYDIEVENYFVEKMSGSRNYRNQATYDPAIDKDTMREHRDKWMQEIVDKVNALGPTKNGYVANRLGPLITICYDIKAYIPSQTMGDKDFKATLNGKDYFYDFRDDLDDDPLKFIDQGDGSNHLPGSGLSGNYNTVGDIELGFTEDNDKGFAGSNWNPFKSDFYPFGSDLRGFTGNHRGNGGLLDCSFIKTQFDAGLFVDSIVYSVDIDKDVMEFGVDTNGNGKIEESEALTPIDSVGPASAGDGTVLECDNGGVLGFIHNPLEWLICPIINGLQVAIDKYDAEITNLLKLKTDKLFDKDRPGDEIGAAFHNAWSSFRTIAMVVLVLIALIMIISQAISVGPFDAYTVKHVMPRLLIAVILISLSWDLMRYAIDLSNILGAGVRGLIYSPFKDAHFDPVALNINFGGAGLLLSGGGASLALLGPFGLLLLAVTGIIAVVTALLILILREMLVMFLVMVAPIAIVCSILPNTQKVWKMWTSYFARALLLFVLFSAVVATGHAFALMSMTLHPGTLGTIFAFIAYFGPYFMLPTIFKMSGGAMAAISGAAYGATQGIRGGLKNARRKQVAKNAQEYGRRAQTSNFFRGAPRESRRSKVNKAIQKATLLSKAGLRPTLMAGKLRQAARDVTESEVADFAQKSTFARWNRDDAKLHAAQYTNREDIGKALEDFDEDRFKGEGHKREREAAITQIMATQKEASPEIFQRARARAQPKTGTGYQHPVTGEFRADGYIHDINDAYGDDRNGAYMALAEAKQDLAQSGQVAGLASYTETAKEMDKLYRAETAVDATPESRVAARNAAHNAIMANTIVSVNPGQAIYGKQSGARAVGKAHWIRIKALADSISSGAQVVETGAVDANGRRVLGADRKPEKRVATRADLSAAVADAAGIADAFGSVTPNNGSAFVNELFDQQLTIPGGEGQPLVKSSVRDFIDAQMDGNEQFHMRRSTIYGSTLRDAKDPKAAQAAALAAEPPADVGGGTPGGLNVGF